VRIGVDLGGTKIEAIALGARGEELARRRVSTPRGDYAATVEAVAALVEAVERDAGERGTVGVGIPGVVVPSTGLVKNSNSTVLIGRPLERDLARRLERPVRTMNDANCFALSEATDGAGAGAGVVFGVILGTGVGGGIVVDGKCLVGANLIAGEWGHNALPWMTRDEYPGVECYCGRRGCIETFLSGPAVERAHHAATGAHVRATAAVGPLYYDRLARALASVINVVDPDVIVLGGGMSNAAGLAEHVQPLLARYVFSNTVSTRVVKNVHGDSSGVRGAAWLWGRDESGAGMNQDNPAQR
jgi:fructokinase